LLWSWVGCRRGRRLRSGVRRRRGRRLRSGFGGVGEEIPCTSTVDVFEADEKIGIRRGRVPNTDLFGNPPKVLWDRRINTVESRTSTTHSPRDNPVLNRAVRIVDCRAHKSRATRVATTRIQATGVEASTKHGRKNVLVFRRVVVFALVEILYRDLHLLQRAHLRTDIFLGSAESEHFQP